MQTYPLWLEKLRDNIFERLSPEKRNDWHVNFNKAINVGMSEKEFEMVKVKFLVFLLDLLLEIKGIDRSIVMIIEKSKKIWLNYIETGVLEQNAIDAAIFEAAGVVTSVTSVDTVVLAATAATAVAYAADVYSDVVYADAVAVAATAVAVAYAADDVADVYEKYADHLIILLKG